MNKKYTLLATLMAFIIMLSFSTNPPNGRTGAPGDGLCLDCHSPSGTPIAGDLSIAGIPGTIIGNTTYTLTVTSSFTGGSPARTGFQMVVLDESDNNIGVLSNPSANTAIETGTGGREYFEHSPAEDFGGNTSVSWDVDWTAPNVPDNEDITFYAAAILGNGGGSANDKMTITNETGTLMTAVDPLMVTLDFQNDVTCFGGSDGEAGVIVTGGVMPYEFDWDNGETTNPAVNLNAGIHIVDVTDSDGESFPFTVEILEANQIEIEPIQIDDETCFELSNGSIQIEAFSDVDIDTYDWSNGDSGSFITDLQADEYIVTVTDDNNCTNTSSFNIDGPSDALEANIDFINDETCFGLSDGTVDLSVANGSGNVDYIWEDGVNESFRDDLTAGIYEVDITDENGCNTFIEFEIFAAQEIFVSEAISNVLCFGDSNGSIDLNVSGGFSPYSYDWGSFGSNQLLSNVPAGDYTVTISDLNDCSISRTYTILSPDSLSIQFDSISTYNCPENVFSFATFSVEGGVAPYMVNIMGSVVVDTLFNVPAGEYVFDIVDANSCMTSQTLVLEGPSAVVIDSFNIINVDCASTPMGSIEIWVSGGNGEYTFDWSNGSTSQNISMLEGGDYSVIINDGNGCNTSATYSVVSPQPLNIDISTINASSVNTEDGSAEILVSGGVGPYSYQGMLLDNDLLLLQNLGLGSYSGTISDALGCSVDYNFFISGGDCNIEVQSNITNVSCFGAADGSIMLNILNAVEPYTISWSNGENNELISELEPGTYDVLVVDDVLCEFSLEGIQITEPEELLVELDIMQPICTGDEGSVVFNITGGTPPYTTNFVEGMQFEGSYSLEISDANQCMTSVNYVIAANDNAGPEIAINATTLYLEESGSVNLNIWLQDQSITDNCGIESVLVDKDSLTCEDLGVNTITITAEDLFGNTSQFLTDITVLDTIAPMFICASDLVLRGCNGIFFEEPEAVDNCNVNVTQIEGPMSGEMLADGVYQMSYLALDDSNNEAICSFTITVMNDFVYDVAITEPTCHGDQDGSIMVFPLSENLQDTLVFNNLGAGVIYFDIFDEFGCSIQDSIDMTEPSLITIDIVDIVPSLNDSAMGAIDINVSGGVAPYSFQWMDENGNIIFLGEDPELLPPGDYALNLTDSNDCLIQLDNITVDIISSNDNIDEVQYSIYPNPAQEYLIIQSDKLVNSVELIDVKGSIILLSANNNRVELPTLAHGLYLIQLNIEGQLFVDKVLIK